MCYLCTNNCSVRGRAGGVGAIATELKSGPGVAKTKEQIGEEKKKKKSFVYAILLRV